MHKSVQITFPFLYFNNALWCYNRIKKKNTVNTLQSSAVIQKNIQRNSIIKKYLSVQITFPFFYFNNTLMRYNRIKKYCEHITFVFSYLKKIQRKSMIKEYKSVQITFPFFYFNNALRCYNRIKKKNIVNTLHSSTVPQDNEQ